MNDNLRFGLILAFFVIAGGVLWFALAGGGPDDSEPYTAERTAQFESEASDSEGDFDRLAIPGTRDTGRPSSPRQKPAAQSRPTSDDRSDARRTGRGSVYGRVSSPEGKLPAGTTVELRAIDWKVSETPNPDSPTYSETVDENGDYEFERVPLGRYVVSARTGKLFRRLDLELTRREPRVRRNLSLLESGSIFGSVGDSAGDPVPEATVYVIAYRQNDRPITLGKDLAASTHVNTDVDGRFAYDNLSVTVDYKFLVKKEGYATFISDEFYPVGSSNVHFTIGQGGEIAGNVVRQNSDEPVPNVTVKLDSGSDLLELAAESAEDGTFLITAAPPGERNLFVSDDVLVAKGSTVDVTVIEGERTEGVRIEVVDGGAIAGRIFDTDTGDGIAAVRVTAGASGHSMPESKEAETDAAGSFEFTALPEGSYIVTHRQVEGYPRNQGRENQRLVTAKLGETMGGVDFPLDRGIVISGIVVDPTGKPVPDASVDARMRSGSQYQYASTQDNGRFVIAGLTIGSDYYIQARSSGYAPAQEGPVELTEDGLHDLRLVLESGASIAGVIVDGSGRPAEDVGIIARVKPQDYFGSRIYESAADGTFEIDQLKSGDYDIILSGPGNHNFNTPAAETVSLEPGEKVAGLRLVFEGQPGLTITGRAVNDRGEPISNIYIQAQGPSWSNGQTGPDGAFTIGGLSEGEYTLMPQHSQYSRPSAPITVAAGTSNVEIVLRGRGTVAGRVVAAASGQPVTDFRIFARRADEQFQAYMRDRFDRILHPDGEFSLDNVEEGDTVLMVEAAGYAPQSTNLSGVSADYPLDDVLIRLQPGATLNGTVVTAGNQPVSGAMIFLDAMPNQWERDRAALARTGRDGAFTLESVQQGQSTVYAYHSEYAPGETLVNVRGQASVQIVLAAGGTIEGQVTIARQPAPNAWVNVSLQNAAPGTQPFRRQTQTGDDGRYRIAGLPPGTATVGAGVQIEGRNSRNRNVTAEIASNGITEVNFDFQLANGTIEGYVYRAEGVGTAANVSAEVATSSGNESAWAQADNTGYYRLENLPAGEVTIGVYVQGLNSQKSFTVDLAEGQNLRKDIHLYGGKTLVVRIAGNLNPQQTSVVLMDGDITFQPRSYQEIAELYESGVVSSAQVGTDGVATLSNLEPGAFTVVALTTDAVDTQNPEEMFANMRYDSAAVTIEENSTEISVNLNL